MQPMAARDGGVSYDQLHHFIAAGVWDAAPLETALLAEADRLVGGDDAWLIVDDTALPKKGRHSVGVAPQYASALGKNANCQTLVSLTLASGEVPVMVGLRLFLPESWTSDPARLSARWRARGRTGATGPSRRSRSRRSTGSARPACALAACWPMPAMALSAPFRQALSERGLAWAVGIPVKQKVYPADVALIFPVAGRGPPAQAPYPRRQVGHRRRRCWRQRPGARQLAARHQGARCRPASPPCACGSPMVRRSGSATWASSICPARRSG